MEDPANNEEKEMPKVDIEFRKFDEEDYNSKPLYLVVSIVLTGQPASF